MLSRLILPEGNNYHNLRFSITLISSLPSFIHKLTFCNNIFLRSASNNYFIYRTIRITKYKQEINFGNPYLKALKEIIVQRK